MNKPEWTKLTIPTEHNSNMGPMYSKSYTIKGLKEKAVYEALLVSRNRYGWSKPSPILRFATAGAGNYTPFVSRVLVLIFFFTRKPKTKIYYAICTLKVDSSVVTSRLLC